MMGIFCMPASIRHAVLTLYSMSHGRLSTTAPCFRHPSRITTRRVAGVATGRSYVDAIALLDGLQSNHSVVTSIASNAQAKNQDAIPEMLEWTRLAGYNVSDFAQRGFKCIHVAGTKGKGSVCAMVEHILLQYREDGQKLVEGSEKHLGKIGLYTSPHLVTVRERIRIDGIPISEALFTRYFFELWDRLTSQAPGPKDLGYFRCLTLLALHAFVEEGVQTAIVECGIGGEYDSTNILPSKAVSVSAITRLGIDHTAMLGNTIEEIAWHKAGIMKAFTPILSVEQVPKAKLVLDQRAQEKDLVVEYVHRHPDIQSGKQKLGLEGDFQKDNASLAIAVASTHLRNLGIITQSNDPWKTEDVPELFARGLEAVKWQARCEVREDGNIIWLIDGAHTEDSLEATGRWYQSKLQADRTSSTVPIETMLIFNQQDRDPYHLLRALIFATAEQRHDQMKEINFLRNVLTPQKAFNYYAFCTNTPFEKDVAANVDLSRQQSMSKIIMRLDCNPICMIYGSAEEAIGLARKVSAADEQVKLMVLVTGSLHLAGAVMEVLDSQKSEVGAS